MLNCSSQNKLSQWWFWWDVLGSFYAAWSQYVWRHIAYSTISQLLLPYPANHVSCTAHQNPHGCLSPTVHTLLMKLDLPTLGKPHTSNVRVFGSIDGRRDNAWRVISKYASDWCCLFIIVAILKTHSYFWRITPQPPTHLLLLHVCSQRLPRGKVPNPIIKHQSWSVLIDFIACSSHWSSPELI